MNFVCNCDIYRVKIAQLTDTIKELKARAELAEQLWKNAQDGTPINMAGASTNTWKQMLQHMLDLDGKAVDLTMSDDEQPAGQQSGDSD